VLDLRGGRTAPWREGAKIRDMQGFLPLAESACVRRAFTGYWRGASVRDTRNAGGQATRGASRAPSPFPDATPLPASSGAFDCSTRKGDSSSRCRESCRSTPRDTCANHHPVSHLQHSRDSAPKGHSHPVSSQNVPRCRFTTWLALPGLVSKLLRSRSGFEISTSTTGLNLGG
jgi:hypothetical protein